MARCHSCQIININGIRTHEIGCPDAWKDYTRKCKWCGSEFKPEKANQECCCHSCAVAYSGGSCDCAECSTEEVT
jgi:hypothetical protein